MIFEILSIGEENALTGKEIGSLLGLSSRQVTKQVETERKAGRLICANTQNPKGYYIPANEHERERYMRSLSHRIFEMYKTMVSFSASADAGNSGRGPAA